MNRIIPSFLADGRDNTNYTGSAFSTFQFLMGEVQAKYDVNDSKNFNKKVPEYDVWCQVMENDTSVARMFSRCVVGDLFGSGMADTFTYTVRPSKSASVGDTNNKLGYGVGSKVCMLAINGDKNNCIIIGGIRNSKSDPIDSSLGHNLNFSFNGIGCKINDDGSFALTYGGANNADGSLRDGVDSNAVGTKIAINADGSVNISDKNGQNSITIDRPNGKIQLNANTEIDLSSNQINLGTTPTDKAVLGTQLISILNELLVNLQALTVTTLGIPSTPPVNAPAFAAIQAELESILSETVNLQ